MDELNQQNQDSKAVEADSLEDRSNLNITDDNKKEEQIIEAVLTDENKSAEEQNAEALPEKNFFAEESYYDTHSLPQQAPPHYTPPYHAQPSQISQPYNQPVQSQFRQPTYPQYPQPSQQQPRQQYQQPKATSPYDRQQSYPHQQQPYRPMQPQDNNYNTQYQQPSVPQYHPQGYSQQNYYSRPDSTGPEINSSGVLIKKKMPAGPIIALIIAVILLAGLTTALIILANQNNGGNNIVKESSSEFQNDSSLDENQFEIPVQNKPNIDEKYKDNDGRYTTQGVAKVVSPSVVGVVIYGQDQSLTPVSQASGIIISADGYIITNAHVVEGAFAQKVILTDGVEYEAQIIGRDSKSDLAVLKIEPKGEIIAADIGNSDQLELGEQVMALGNPGGLENSISGGYVSGLDRQIKSSETGLAMNCIQTDAAVNPGNSGGALVNMYGQVVGIISSKYVATDYEGIGFAISINDALPVIQDIIDKGYVSNRVRIGIIFVELTDTTADMYEVVPGLYVNEIDPTCDVSGSGLQIHDIITEMNGQKVYNYETVMKAIDGQKPGDTVTAKVYRKTIVGDISEFEISFKLMEDTTAQ